MYPLTPILKALGRCLGSSTWLTAVLSIAVQLFAQSRGIAIAPEILAAAPIAVAWKEGQRRRSEADVEVAELHSSADRAVAHVANETQALHAALAEALTPQPQRVRPIDVHDSDDLLSTRVRAILKDVRAEQAKA